MSEVTMMQEGHESSEGSVSMIQHQSVKGVTSTGSLAPGWWFQNFNPIWGPLMQWLHRQRHMTLSEFRLITSHVSGLTAVEKTIVLSAFIAYKNMQY